MCAVLRRVKVDKKGNQYVHQYETRYNKVKKRTEQFNHKYLGRFTGTYDENGKPNYIPTSSSIAYNMWGLVRDFVEKDPYLINTEELVEIYKKLAVDFYWVLRKKESIVLSNYNFFRPEVEIGKQNKVLYHELNIRNESVEIYYDKKYPHRVFPLYSRIINQFISVSEKNRVPVFFRDIDNPISCNKNNYILSKRLLNIENSFQSIKPTLIEGIEKDTDYSFNDYETIDELNLLIISIKLLKPIESFLIRSLTGNQKDKNFHHILQVSQYALFNILLEWAKRIEYSTHIEYMLTKGMFINFCGYWFYSEDGIRFD